MSINEREVDVIRAETSKLIEGDIAWGDRARRRPEKVFRAYVDSEPGWPLYIDGYWNPYSGKLGYTLVHDRSERIVGLDLGIAHNNPKGDSVGDTHKHKWSDQYQDDDAYEPSDITANWSEPIEVWRQFCAEEKITHRGVMHNPEWQQERIP